MPGFKDALQITLRFEGGLADNPSDPGGRTMKGVTQSVYDSYRSTKSLPKQDVALIATNELEDIYYNGYWLTGHCDKLSWPVNMCHFDASVNHGTKGAARILQRAAGVKDDGIIGPNTLNAINSIPVGILVNRMLWERIQYYLTICLLNGKLRIFLLAWISRTKALYDITKSYISG